MMLIWHLPLESCVGKKQQQALQSLDSLFFGVDLFHQWPWHHPFKISEVSTSHLITSNLSGLARQLRWCERQLVIQQLALFPTGNPSCGRQRTKGDPKNLAPTHRSFQLLIFPLKYDFFHPPIWCSPSQTGRSSDLRNGEFNFWILLFESCFAWWVCSAMQCNQGYSMKHLFLKIFRGVVELN